MKSRKDKYVIVTDEELDGWPLNRAATSICGDLFHWQKSRRSISIGHTFWAPAAGSEKAYKLLAETMAKSKLAGIAHVCDARQRISGRDLSRERNSAR
jgi:non-homologous end joining protein Ku